MRMGIICQRWQRNCINSACEIRMKMGLKSGRGISLSQRCLRKRELFIELNILSTSIRLTRGLNRESCIERFRVGSLMWRDQRN